MTTSNNVTEALQRTITLMQGELEKSVLSTQLLGKSIRILVIGAMSEVVTDQSSVSLKSASSTHDVLDGLMVTSKQLITALEKSDWLDRMLILAALLFFILVVLFILKQRLVDKSLRIVFWWTRFIPSSSSTRATERVVNAMEKGALTASVSDITTAASSVVAAVTSTFAAAAASSSIITSVPVSSPDISSVVAETVTLDVTTDAAEKLFTTPPPEPTPNSEVEAADSSTLASDIDSQTPLSSVHDEL